MFAIDQPPNKSPDATRVGAFSFPFRFHRVRLSSVAGASAPALGVIATRLGYTHVQDGRTQS